MKYQNWTIGGTSHSSIFINQISEQPKQPERHYLAFTILSGNLIGFDSEFSVRWSKDKKTWIEDNYISVNSGETWYCTGDIVTSSLQGPIGHFQGNVCCNLSGHIDGLLHPLYYTGTTSREDVINSIFYFLLNSAGGEIPDGVEKEEIVIQTLNSMFVVDIAEDVIKIMQNSGINQHTIKNFITSEEYQQIHTQFKDGIGFLYNLTDHQELFKSSNAIYIEDASGLIFRPNIPNIYGRLFNSVNKITLAEGMISIDPAMFYQCLLQEITIPSTIKLIGQYAFERDSQLSSITFKPKVCPKIEVGAFRGVPNEGTLYLPKDCDLESYVNNLPAELSNWNYEFI